MQNLIGKRFGKLTVLSRATSILGGKSKRKHTAYNCICDCGKSAIVKTVNLNRGSTKSCGCIIRNGRSLKPGKKINRLTTISYKDGKWFCLCECGNHIEVKTNTLNNNNTKSCGCLKSEVSKNKSDALIAGRRQFEPRIASARRVWKAYYYRDKDCNILFDEFIELSQKSCFYCGIEPNTKYNYFSTISSRSSTKAEKEGLFVYNGLDRIDSGKPHTLDNVVSCCYVCNRAKNNRNVDDFNRWIDELKIINYNPGQIEKLELPIGSLGTSIKCVFYNYNDADLLVEQFHYISQMDCFYCESVPANVFNRAKIDKKSSAAAKAAGDFIYNGIDRVDVVRKHSEDNIVACCKYCNFAKSNLSLVEFQAWIERIKRFRENNVG